jgi:hypothetical protein
MAASKVGRPSASTQPGAEPAADSSISTRIWFWKFGSEKPLMFTNGGVWAETYVKRQERPNGRRGGFGEGESCLLKDMSERS